ncbi:riboflavin synthase subunit alpha [Clostridium tetani]|uniref:Riboflavin synthase n=1 Tax=Clostridium tetani TaxID=1513 RepID=A0A4Q0V949_CLOTA|nr:riboflavin synthase [Clostridium tetani]RXI45358.1 riboflavin synthase [Clostridium tetani]BDR66265.1 riboflavin synthase subunit alpha [Clostridium tetani]BDR80241.1 riboflavin synthase subunit alpha [Clostridium tetani]BDR88691.1 riboflavin synthase subunit alpha [Clostridium tetani]
MFTGIVEELGSIQSIEKKEDTYSIKIKAKKVLKDVNLGDSICTNGVCLTVTDFSKDSFTVDVMPETIRQSNLKNIKKGSLVNLERALRATGRLGGHIVSGHIDGEGIIKEYKKEGNAWWISVEPEKGLLKYVIERGSIALDGVSLTVAYVDQKLFKVSVIPHTSEETTLLKKGVGDILNIECDLIGKYVEKILNFKNHEEEQSKIDMDFLKNNGFF